MFEPLRQKHSPIAALLQGQQVKRLPDGIWMFGGPASASAYIDALVTALSA